MQIRIGNAVAIEPSGSPYRNSGSSTNTHEAKKARAAYLITYITERGNEIDQLNASGQNPRNYWRAIIEAQNELINIYNIELNGNTDPDCIRILRSNIAKLTRGREFALDAVQQGPAPLGRDGTPMMDPPKRIAPSTW
jgi:hypothetical protein